MKELKYLEKIIYECVSIKSAVVSKDEKEVTGLRKILNFGHTFAHAFESTSSYKISHGKAVIAGIVGALNLSYEKRLIDEVQLNYMIKLPMKFKFSTDIKKLNSKAIFNRMSVDKKNKDGKINFVLLRDFGEILVDVSVDRKSVIKSLEITEQNWFKRATAGL
jgi:3-dehydroquinate synthase